MKLSSKELFLLNQCAISAAYQAAYIIATHNSLDRSVESKKAGSSPASQIVTKVDMLCQDIILQTLLPTCDIFDLALLSEERTDDLMRLEKDYFWCIDPLDGTLPFVESIPGYAVSIALVSRDGIPQIGVVYDPVEQRLYHAIKEQGAYRNGKQWKLENDSVLRGKSFSFITDRSFTQTKYYAQVIAELKNSTTHLGYGDLKIISQGGAAMNACWVLENDPACYFKFPKAEKGGGSLWDYAATACLFQEAGAVVTDIYGHALDLNRADSTFMNHRGILYGSNQNINDYIINLYTQFSNT